MTSDNRPLDDVMDDVSNRITSLTVTYLVVANLVPVLRCLDLVDGLHCDQCLACLYLIDPIQTLLPCLTM
jgi:hypothetical protein